MVQRLTSLCSSMLEGSVLVGCLLVLFRTRINKFFPRKQVSSSLATLMMLSARPALHLCQKWVPASMQFQQALIDIIQPGGPRDSEEAVAGREDNVGHKAGDPGARKAPSPPSMMKQIGTTLPLPPASRSTEGIEHGRRALLWTLATLYLVSMEAQFFEGGGNLFQNLQTHSMDDDLDRFEF